MGRKDAETETFIAQVSGTLNANGKAAGSATQQDAETGMLIAFHAEAQADQLPIAGRDTSISASLTASQHAAVAQTSTANMYWKSGPDSGAGRGGNVMAVTQTAPTLTSNGDAHSGYRDEHGLVPVAEPIPYDFFQITAPINRQNRQPGDPCHTFARDNASHAAIQKSMQVRRLTPRECERLQGFPDDYTLIPHRNKAAADGPRYKALGNSMAVSVMRWIGERIQMVEDITKKI
jgi:DNA (cytosine-5)-methyltransferase 1